jgi:hypothetical protein
VFARAREAARKTTCLNNVKQLALAVLMYAQDYDETMPSCDATHRDYCAHMVRKAWQGRYSRYQGTEYFPFGGDRRGGLVSYLLPDLLMPYVKNPSLFNCPTLSKSGDTQYQFQMATLDNNFFSTPTSKNYWAYPSGDAVCQQAPWLFNMLFGNDAAPSIDPGQSRCQDFAVAPLQIIKGQRKTFMSGSYAWGCNHLQNPFLSNYWGTGSRLVGCGQTTGGGYPANFGWRSTYYVGEPDTIANGSAYREGYYMDVAMGAGITKVTTNSDPNSSGGRRTMFNPVLYTVCAAPISQFSNVAAKPMLWCISNVAHESISPNADGSVVPPGAREAIALDCGASAGTGLYSAGSGQVYPIAKVAAYADGHAKYFRGSMYDWCAIMFAPVS